jgi:LacI family transcriptional regulator
LAAPRLLQWVLNMTKPLTPKRIAFYSSALMQDSPRVEEGILRYQEDHPGFVFRSFHYDSEHVPERFDLVPLPWNKWIPDGIIASLGHDPGLPEWLAQGGQPLVTIGSDWIGQWPCVFTAPDSIATLALEHFEDQGFRHFGFVGIAGPGSHMRWEAWARSVRARGRLPLLYELEHSPNSGLAEHVEQAASEIGLQRWLREAPKPLAVLTAGDRVAYAVCAACTCVGLAIPHDVAVMGLGNTPAARSCLPPLTSIHSPTEEVGYKAMALLDQLLHEDKGRAIPAIEVPALRLVVRQSTQEGGSQLAAPHRLRKLIHEQACLAGNIDQIAAPLQMSRKTLNRQFAAAFGCTPGAELLRVRLAKAKELLLTPRPLKTVASELGYGSVSAFIHFFRKQAGLTPREYQRSIEPRAGPRGPDSRTSDPAR